MEYERNSKCDHVDDRIQEIKEVPAVPTIKQKKKLYLLLEIKQEN
jgi:hypothetical protein